MATSKKNPTRPEVATASQTETPKGSTEKGKPNEPALNSTKVSETATRIDY